ncbi:hypothetical protein PIB30_103958 [Stylosanthes scabra]|uniref:Putative plant transposon protein domain-containing protein n=1 Tax=Stylosanthes scabra TaxID=79078 RepID=A0ABU6UXV9_9FABA|nr:hypothetical protein [Stylosanthes scabra]
MEQAEQHRYKSYVRGVEVDFSPENIRRVLRFKEQTPDAEMDYPTRQRRDQRLDEVLTDLCIPGATWRLSSGQPAQPIQLRGQNSLHWLVDGKNSSSTPSYQPATTRAILIHSIIRGEDARAEELIADNIVVIAQGMQGKGKLAFPRIIYKLCKDAQVPLHEFGRTELIPQDKPITARLMEITRLGRNVQVQQQQNEEEEEDQPMLPFEGGNEEGHDQGQHQHFEQQFQQPEACFQQNYWEQQ